MHCTNWPGLHIPNARFCSLTHINTIHVLPTDDNYRAPCCNARYECSTRCQKTHAPSSMHAVSKLMQMLLLQGLKGRLISARYTVLHTAIHGGTLLAIVCPDGSTAAVQKPCALRVYSLDISTPAGTWELCSPCEQDGASCKYPLPRNQPACTEVGSKVRNKHLFYSPPLFC